MLSRSWNEMWRRLRADSELAIIAAFAACGIFGIVPFAIYRFATGNPFAGTVDLVIVASICLAVVHAARSADRRRPRLFLAIVNTVGCLASATVLGPPGLFWMYPALLGNFLLLSRGWASVVTALALTFLAVQGKAYESMAQLSMFLVTAVVSGLVAFVFASRTESQRQALERLATLDSLTGVPNRRAMEQELQIAVAEHRREGTAYGLAMLDLDHFKGINDEHGHEAGDEVLIAFARLVACSTRKVDRIFRFGGEEFVLLMPATHVDGLHAIDASVRARVAEQLDCRGRAVTVSIGAASLRPDEDWQAWMSRADAALYMAKRQGRNRTVVDSGESA
ncbi:MAG: GGDEF domain-containing protein [Arenimonas sp.]|nr:GGDEF domain-containing protein [Arenimonas sp.]